MIQMAETEEQKLGRCIYIYVLHVTWILFLLFYYNQNKGFPDINIT